MSNAPGLDVGCVPDRPRSQPCERLREVISLRVLESSALGHTKYLSGLSETCETKSPHPAQAYDRDRRDTPLRPIDTLYAIDSFGERVSAEKLLKSFDAHLRRRGRADSTRRQYLYSLRVFCDWLGPRGVGDLAPADLELFLTTWEAGFHGRHSHLPRPATMRGMIGALRVFFAYLEQAEFLVGVDGSLRRNPVRTIDAPPCPQRPNDFLRTHEDRALLSADCSHHHRIVVWLLRYTGVRVAEAQALTVADLDLTPEGEALTIRGGKTPAATRTIPLLPQLLPLVHEHLEFLRGRLSVTSDTPLLATGRGTAMTPNYLWRVVKRVAYEAGVRPVPCTCATRRQDRHVRGCPRTMSGENRSSISPHTLRRTFGSDLINRGLRLETVSKLLGHSSTTITERAYAQLLAPTIRRELFEAFAHNRPPVG
jgi:site-specific recombinase XerD